MEQQVGLATPWSCPNSVTPCGPKSFSRGALAGYRRFLPSKALSPGKMVQEVTKPQACVSLK